MPYKRHRCIIHYSTHAVNARFSRIRILNLTKSESFDCEISIFRWLERFQCNSHFFMYVRICKQGDFSNHQKQEKPFCNERLLLCGCLYSRKSPSKAFQLSSSIPAVSAVQAVRRAFLLRCGRVKALRYICFTEHRTLSASTMVYTFPHRSKLGLGVSVKTTVFFSSHPCKSFDCSEAFQLRG